MRKLYIHKETKEVLHVSAFPETDLKDNVFEGTEVECITEHTEGFDWGDTWTPPYKPTDLENAEAGYLMARRDLLDTMKRAYTETLENLLPEAITEGQALYIAKYGIHPVGYIFIRRFLGDGTQPERALPPYGVWERLSGEGFLRFKDGTPQSYEFRNPSNGHQGDVIRNIHGSIYQMGNRAGLTGMSTGALWFEGETWNAKDAYSGGRVPAIIRFDSYRVVPTGCENRPANQYLWEIWERKA